MISISYIKHIVTPQDEEQRESIALTDTGIWTTSECKSCFLWYYERI